VCGLFLMSLCCSANQRTFTINPAPASQVYSLFHGFGPVLLPSDHCEVSRVLLLGRFSTILCLPARVSLCALTIFSIDFEQFSASHNLNMFSVFTVETRPCHSVLLFAVSVTPLLLGRFHIDVSVVCATHPRQSTEETGFGLVCFLSVWLSGLLCLDLPLLLSVSLGLFCRLNVELGVGRLRSAFGEIREWETGFSYYSSCKTLSHGHHHDVKLRLTAGITFILDFQWKSHSKSGCIECRPSSNPAVIVITYRMTDWFLGKRVQKWSWWTIKLPTKPRL
jgi:hypothetical protein